MARKKKNEDVISPVLLEIEAALKAKIEEIEKLHDPAERLLKYKALKEATAGTYDLTKVRKSRVIVVDDALGKGISNGFLAGFGGFWVGAAAGAVAFFGFASVVGAGIAVGVGSLSFVGSTVLGFIIGKKKGNAAYNKYTPEEKHATQMSDMAHGVNKAIERLVSSYTDPDNRDANLKALEKSPSREQVLKEFPRITTAFNDYAAKQPADQTVTTTHPVPSSAKKPAIK